MRRGPVILAGLVGLWAAFGPVLNDWSFSAEWLAGNLAPGILAAAIGFLGASLRPEPDLELYYDLMRRTLSNLVLLGAWLLLAPLLLGLPQDNAWMHLTGTLPGAMVIGLSLLNGYLGWRARPA